MNMLIKYKGYLLSLAAFCFLIIIIYHQNLIKYGRPVIPFLISSATSEEESEIQKTVNRIYHQVDETISKINITEKIKTTSAKHSKVFLKYPKDRYCVGDQLVVQVGMFDYSGKMKTYGGDYLRARMSTSAFGAGSSGRIEDFNNGTYHVHFILFWAGTINITVFMMHPSEGASALWIYRNKWYGYVDHFGKFEAPQQEKETICGFDLDQSKELCDYKDERDEEHFYCIKPENFSCNSLTHVKSWRRLDNTLFTTTEKSLFNRSNIRVEIPKDFHHLHVLQCKNTLTPFTLYDDNWARQLLSLDVKKNMKITWKRHTFPFLTGAYQSFKEERTIAREIDLIRGDQRTVIVLNIGMHFRAYPIHHFIRRLYNICRAIERLFIRSPKTKVIIKTENTSPMLTGFESLSDFHGSVHYFIMEIFFKDLNVGFVNGWDMTNAFDTNEIHPPEKVIENEIRMLMTYIC
ncbi:NXPE family member 1-like isoform X2 [Phyllobates terribilis]|uniref:NXPE family member 1-like isoform X2 n=1 Tax=Phyllobates terribilis TaxID=111132 RepID=UPI003CCAE693